MDLSAATGLGTFSVVAAASIDNLTLKMFADRVRDRELLVSRSSAMRVWIVDIIDDGV